MLRRYLIIDGYNLMHARGLARRTYGPGQLERCRRSSFATWRSILSGRRTRADDDRFRRGRGPARPPAADHRRGHDGLFRLARQRGRRHDRGTDRRPFRTAANPPRFKRSPPAALGAPSTWGFRRQRRVCRRARPPRSHFRIRARRIRCGDRPQRKSRGRLRNGRGEMAADFWRHFGGGGAGFRPGSLEQCQSARRTWRR